MSFLKFDINDAKEYLFDELNFRNSHQSKYYPRENVNSASDIFNILSDYYMISKDEDFYLDLIQGLFIPGGSKFCEYDRYLLERAIEKNIPVLGVCLGMQLMSCYKEDVILEKIEDSNIEHNVDLSVKYAHKVKIDRNSKLYGILQKDEINVNSFHNYSVTPNEIYKTVARSEDGIIEAIEYPSKTFNMGVQWHVEKMYDYDEDAKKIMDCFIKEASYRKTIITEKVRDYV